MGVISFQPKSANPCSQLCQMLPFQHFGCEPSCVALTKVGQFIWKILTQHLDLFTSLMSDWEGNSWLVIKPLVTWLIVSVRDSKRAESVRESRDAQVISCAELRVPRLSPL